MLSEKKMRAAAVVSDPRWQALVQRDAKVVGAFVYGVKTTGVYCQPACSSRLALPENIVFYDTPAQAELAGFRPCRRCRPERPAGGSRHGHAEMVAALCRFIEAADHVPSLDDLARRAGFSPHHLHRVFKAVTGLTPKAYAAAYRAGRVRQALEGVGSTGGAASVAASVYAAGYDSSGRFYAESNQVLGMTPGDYRAGGAGVDIYFAVGQCSLGAILVARSPRGVCGILLGDDPDDLVRQLQDRFYAANLLGGEADFESLVARVVGFVEAPRLGLDLPLDIQGTVFQRRVWEALQQIPAGCTVSYAEVARRIGAPEAARAVAGACAANMLAVAIPCHRVIRNDGRVSGYRWGVERKQALLAREQEDGLFNPRSEPVHPG